MTESRDGKPLWNIRTAPCLPWLDFGMMKNMEIEPSGRLAMGGLVLDGFDDGQPGVAKMAFVPVKSLTESIVDPDAAFMEFQLEADIGYQEWCGMFNELGVKATLFHAYAVQTGEAALNVSTTAVQLHHYEHSLFIAPPFEVREYYAELPRPSLKLGKVYFRLPADMRLQPLEGYKPDRMDLYAIDLWTVADDRAQKIYSFFYEARIRTADKELHVHRFDINDWQPSR